MPTEVIVPREMPRNKRRNNRVRIRLGLQQQVDISGILGVPCPLCLAVFALCRINRKVNGQLPMTIEHAPPQQADTQQAPRCLTCRKCNNEAAFEARAGQIKLQRRSALEQVELQGLPKGGSKELTDLLNIAAISDDEFLVELKTAYLIAYATLGNNYIFDSGLDNVRTAISTHSVLPLFSTGNPNSSSPICARVSSSTLKVEHPILGQVMELRGPFTALGVGMPPTHPTHGDASEHVVIVPRYDSPPDLYDRIGILGSGKLTIGPGLYDIPPKHTVLRNPTYEGSQERWSVESADLRTLRAEHDQFMQDSLVESVMDELDMG